MEKERDDVEFEMHNGKGGRKRKDISPIDYERYL